MPVEMGCMKLHDSIVSANLLPKTVVVTMLDNVR
jgi:hypothetical protein